MSRQTTLSDVAAQRTLTESADAPTERDDDTPTTERALLDHKAMYTTLTHSRSCRQSH
ncbi:hypothetical protein ACFFQF_21590 [Haladaptatus pallidirubidus]|uniref:hypothetical protein n=1 Tax=Haladaptatus pallidirubidus TaxID=1008152 RepID=UPI0031E537A2